MKSKVFSEVVAERLLMDLEGFTPTEAERTIKSIASNSPDGEFEGNTIAICFDRETDTVTVEDVFCEFEPQSFQETHFWSILKALLTN